MNDWAEPRFLRCPWCGDEMDFQDETHLYANNAWTCAACGGIFLAARTVCGYRPDGTYLYEATEY